MQVRKYNQTYAADWLFLPSWSHAFSNVQDPAEETAWHCDSLGSLDLQGGTDPCCMYDEVDGNVNFCTVQQSL